MEFCDLMERGVLDPAKVTINAIENSASVAGLVLTTECLVTEIPIILSEEQKQQAMLHKIILDTWACIQKACVVS